MSHEIEDVQNIPEFTIKQKEFSRAFLENALRNNFKGIIHTRCWYVDMIKSYTGESFNYYNKIVSKHPDYPLSLWSPMNNLALKWGPKISNEDMSIIVEIMTDIFWPEQLKIEMNLNTLADKLLEFRVKSSIKLKIGSPLLAVPLAIAKDKGYKFEKVSFPNLLMDLSDNSGVGSMHFYRISNPNNRRSCMFNAVAVHDHHGDDKSKEWGARRTATLYRYEDKRVRVLKEEPSIFVADGEWEEKDLSRLYRCGWDFVVPLKDFEETLCKVLG